MLQLLRIEVIAAVLDRLRLHVLLSLHIVALQHRLVAHHTVVEARHIVVAAAVAVAAAHHRIVAVAAVAARRLARTLRAQLREAVARHHRIREEETLVADSFNK